MCCRRLSPRLPGESRAFLGVNRSKHGIVIDLKKPEGLQVLRRLVARTDVLVHNFRPSVPKRLGIDYESLCKVNGRLIYCALTGYGSNGPMKDQRRPIHNPAKKPATVAKTNTGVEISANAK